MTEQTTEQTSESTPPRSFYEVLGGQTQAEKILRLLVDTFYEVMDTDPKAKGIRAMHAPDLTEAKEKLYMFMVGWTGGPQLYIEQYGHPRLRARHMPFAIGESERDQWMYCMISAMHRLKFDDTVMVRLSEQLYGVADFMRNKES